MITTTKMMTSAAVLAAALSTTALADNHMSGGDTMNSGRVTADNIENLLRTSDIIGGNVYTLDVDYDMNIWDEADYYDTVETEWEMIGNIEDIALSRNGQMTGVVVESGGFLGIGDDSVLIELSSLRLIDDGSGDYNWVTNISEEQFEDMPEVQENWW